MVALLLLVACGSLSEAPPEPATGSEPAAPAQAPAATSAPAASEAPAQVPAATLQNSGPSGSSQPSTSMSALAPTAIPAPANSEEPVAAITESPEGTLRMGLDEVGPPKWILKIQGAPQNSINNTTFWESLWSNQRGKGLVGRIQLQGAFSILFHP